MQDLESMTYQEATAYLKDAITAVFPNGIEQIERAIPNMEERRFFAMWLTHCIIEEGDATDQTVALALRTSVAGCLPSDYPTLDSTLYDTYPYNLDEEFISFHANRTGMNECIKLLLDAERSQREFEPAIQVIKTHIEANPYVRYQSGLVLDANKVRHDKQLLELVGYPPFVERIKAELPDLERQYFACWMFHGEYLGQNPDKLTDTCITAAKRCRLPEDCKHIRLPYECLYPRSAQTTETALTADGIKRAIATLELQARNSDDKLAKTALEYSAGILKALV